MNTVCSPPQQKGHKEYSKVARGGLSIGLFADWQAKTSNTFWAQSSLNDLPFFADDINSINTKDGITKNSDSVEEPAIRTPPQTSSINCAQASMGHCCLSLWLSSTQGTKPHETHASKRRSPRRSSRCLY